MTKAAVHAAVALVNEQIGAFGKTLKWNPTPATLPVAVGDCVVTVPTVLVVEICSDQAGAGAPNECSPDTSCSDETKARHARDAGASALLLVETRKDIYMWFTPGSHWMANYDGTGQDGSGHSALAFPTLQYARLDAAGAPAGAEPLWTADNKELDVLPWAALPVCNATAAAAAAQPGGAPCPAASLVSLAADEDGWIRSWTFDVVQCLLWVGALWYFDYRIIRNVVVSKRRAMWPVLNTLNTFPPRGCVTASSCF